LKCEKFNFTSILSRKRIVERLSTSANTIWRFCASKYIFMNKNKNETLFLGHCGGVKRSENWEQKRRKRTDAKTQEEMEWG
jgi:hypothetical protein